VPAVASAGARDIPPGVRRASPASGVGLPDCRRRAHCVDVFLALSLPKENLEQHYRLTWTGFDLILVLAI
jgi:hypothetical protein